MASIDLFSLEADNALGAAVPEGNSSVKVEKIYALFELVEKVAV